MLKSMIVLLIAISSFSISLADTEFQEGVPLELVKALIGPSPYGETKVYSDIMNSFPDIGISDKFSVLGSIDRGYALSVILTTELSSNDTKAFFTETLEDAGFEVFEVPGSRDPDNGFVAPNAPTFDFGNRFCHDSLGFISFTQKEQDDLNIVSLSLNRPRDRRSCVAQFEEQAQGMARRNGFLGGVRQYLPKMILPESEPRLMTPFGGMGISSSNNELEARAVVNVDWEIEQLYSHFKTQVEDQAWELDSENIGNSTAFGSWVLNPEAGVSLIGTLSIINSGDESFELKFQLTQTGSRTNRGSGVFLQR